MSKVPVGPHAPCVGTWWNSMGWEGEEEYTETLVGPCERCRQIEVLDDLLDEKLCFDCWWSARQAAPCFFLKSTSSPLYLGGIHGPTGYTREEADVRALEFPPGKYVVVPGDWSQATGRVSHNGYMARRRRELVG